MDEYNEIDNLKDELNHFIKLSQVQEEQLKRYQDLQQRSHRLIKKLQDQLEYLKTQVDQKHLFKFKK